MRGSRGGEDARGSGELEVFEGGGELGKTSVCEEMSGAALRSPVFEEGHA